MTGRNAGCRECGRRSWSAPFTDRACDGQRRARASHARDDGRRSELVTTVTTSVGRGDDGSCSHGGIDVRHGVAALVANGDGADACVAQGSRTSSCRSELQHGRGGRTRRRTFAIGTATMIVILIGRSMRTGMALGDGGVRLGRGSALAERRHSSTTIRRRTAERQAGSKCRGSRPRLAQRARHHRHRQCRTG